MLSLDKAEGTFGDDSTIFESKLKVDTLNEVPYVSCGSIVRHACLTVKLFYAKY